MTVDSLNEKEVKKIVKNLKGFVTNWLV